ncbi:DUF3311 domain-containing protein [Skermania sp. ID1734]|uniref:DUF3311 domain-containing protein n=1 Tax=Skermania sp. ID1734 TaxID=2597516 RepID=UPI0011803084|nr:DUF3311 domain-containing protein [Skermania sp. ID1734]TSD97263.1 DUF3311 domain-containing protein [Skermania sp. ID1734]
MQGVDDEPTEVATRAPARVRSYLAAGVLLAAAIVIPLLVPTYARVEPRLLGFPFFFWYQILWMFVSAALVGSAYWIVRLEDRRRRARGSATVDRGAE